jgi:FkbM family methyltransferase
MSLQDLRLKFEQRIISRDEYYEEAFKIHQSTPDYSNCCGTGENLRSIAIDSSGAWLLLENGLKLAWNPIDKKSAPNVLVNEGQYEHCLATSLLRLCADSRTVLDIGANIGYYSLNIAQNARSVNNNVVVYAFEPAPENVKALNKNIQENALSEYIVVVPCCVGDRDCVQTLYLPKNRYTAASTRDLHPETTSTQVVVDQIVLDSFILENSIQHVDFIKVDVEGAELFVLNGGLKTIERDRPIMILELLRKWSAQFGYHPNQVFSILKNLEYSMFAIGNTQLSRIERMTDETTETNFLFIPSEKLEKTYSVIHHLFADVLS